MRGQNSESVISLLCWLLAATERRVSITTRPHVRRLTQRSLTEVVCPPDRIRLRASSIGTS